MERAGAAQTPDDSGELIVLFIEGEASVRVAGLHASPGLTTQSYDRMMQGMRFTLCLVLLLCAACAMKPPAQEMSDARSAIKTAQQLPGGDNASKADRYLQSAEQALDQAAEAMRAEQYDRARNKALEARRNAQEAARIKQSNK